MRAFFDAYFWSFFRVVKRKELNIANLSQIIHGCVHTVPLFSMSNGLTRSDTCFLSAIRGVIGGRGFDSNYCALWKRAFVNC